MTVSEVDPPWSTSSAIASTTDPRVTVREVDLLDVSAGDHSCVVALNVLEHIADDVRRAPFGSAAR